MRRMDVEGLRLAVYAAFVRTGRAPALHELAEATGADRAAVTAALPLLHQDRHLVLDGNGERIVMAHPFAAVPLGFSVMGTATLWWGGCAWDAFALPHVVPGESQVLVATRCPGCGAAHAWVVTTQGPPEGAQVAHFLVPMARVWDDVVHACANQRLFCGEGCVATGRERTGTRRGDGLALPTLGRLAAPGYAGGLRRGYPRREPTA